jgi:hypothetical protein
MHLCIRIYISLSLFSVTDCLIERDMNGTVEPQTPPDSPGSLGVGVGKPPRHQLTSIRHCASSMRIAAAASSNYVSHPQLAQQTTRHSPRE